MILLEGTRGIDRIFMTSAIAVNDATIAVLQKGGFVYLDYEYAVGKPFVTPSASLADGSGANGLKKKTIYPVFITRPEPGTPRDDFKPIDSQGLITVIMDSGYECFATSDSYHQDPANGYPDIARGDALKVVSNADTGNRPKLVVDNDGAGTFETTVSYALSTVSDGKVRIKWL